MYLLLNAELTLIQTRDYDDPLVAMYVRSQRLLACTVASSRRILAPQLS